MKRELKKNGVTYYYGHMELTGIYLHDTKNHMNYVTGFAVPFAEQKVTQNSMIDKLRHLGVHKDELEILKELDS